MMSDFLSHALKTQVKKGTRHRQRASRYLLLFRTCGRAGDKTLLEKTQMIDALPEEEKNLAIKIIELAITKKK